MFQINDVVGTQYGIGTIINIFHNGDCEIEISGENGKTLCNFNANPKDLILVEKYVPNDRLGQEGF